MLSHNFSPFKWDLFHTYGWITWKSACNGPLKFHPADQISYHPKNQTFTKRIFMSCSHSFLIEWNDATRSHKVWFLICLGFVFWITLRLNYYISKFCCSYYNKFIVQVICKGKVSSIHLQIFWRKKQLILRILWDIF